MSARALTLNAKVGLVIAVACAVLIACFVSILLPFQRNQRARLIEHEERLVTILREKFERDIIYDLLSQNRESLAVDLAALARQDGLLWVSVRAEGLTVSGTGDAETKRYLLGDASGVDPADRAALMIGDAGAAVLVGDGGRVTALEHAIPGDRFAGWGGEGEAAGAGGFREVLWPTGTSALHSDGPLRAADQVFGSLHIVYSLAELRRIEGLTRNSAYLLSAAVVAVVLLLLRVLLSRAVLRPVHAVAEAMRQASGGDLSVRLGMTRRDEIGLMAHAFNDMVAELERSKAEIEGHRRTLEHTVEERTHELRRSEERYRDVSRHLEAVIASAATGVVSLDRWGGIGTFNQRAVEILGLSPGQLVGARLEDALAGHAAAKLLDVVADARARGVARARLTLRLPEGSRTLAVVASALPADPGAVPGMVVVVDDLTQVLQAQKLEAWKEAVERVIHEIKNPLTPIGLATETLRRAFAEDRARFDTLFPSASEMILRAVRDLRTLITEFTRFYRMPRMTLKAEDVNRLVEEMLAAYGGGLPGAPEIRAVLGPALPPVEVDVEQMKRVLLNVVNNALEAMEGRPGEVVVRTAVSGRDVVISVEDTGVGIDDPARLFEPYYTTKAKGTGLGLVISRQVVEEHGGRMEVASALGVGTTVRVLLPAAPGTPA